MQRRGVEKLEKRESAVNSCVNGVHVFRCVVFLARYFLFLEGFNEEEAVIYLFLKAIFKEERHGAIQVTLNA